MPPPGQNEALCAAQVSRSALFGPGCTALIARLDYAVWLRRTRGTVLVGCRQIAGLLRRQQRGAIRVIYGAAPPAVRLLAKDIGGAAVLVDPATLAVGIAQPGLHDHQRIVGPLYHLHGPLLHPELALKIVGDGTEGTADGGDAAHHHAGFDHQGGVLGVEGHQGIEVAARDGGIAGLDKLAKRMLAHAVLLNPIRESDAGFPAG